MGDSSHPSYGAEGGLGRNCFFGRELGSINDLGGRWGGRFEGVN